MSDQDLGKKMVEESELEQFFEAYRRATGGSMAIIRRSERPDFICLRGDNSEVGLELTSVVRDPATRFWDNVLENRLQMDPHDALALVVDLIEEKERKRGERGWGFAANCILVIQLKDCSLDDLKPLLDDLGPAEFSGSGFVEIWLADRTTLEAYREVALFGLYPKELWGDYGGVHTNRKPFG